MMRGLSVLTTDLAIGFLPGSLLAQEGIVGDVVRVDHKKQCLWLDWDNDTEKIACWTDQTRFSVLETKKPAKPADVRKGSYVRMQGEHKDGAYWAAEVVIWEELSKPPGQ